MRIKLNDTAAVLLGAGLLSLTAMPVCAQGKNPERNVYYGETHLHTSWSFDACAPIIVAGSSGLPCTIFCTRATARSMNFS